MITTEMINGTPIRIEWEIGDIIDDLGDGHELCWCAEGYNIDSDQDESIYWGTAIMIDGEFTEINDVYSE